MAVQAEAELEIVRDGEDYALTLRREIINDPTEQPYVHVRVKIDEDALRATPSHDAYGELLGKQLFADPTLWATFRDLHASARARGELRLRLAIDRSAVELHRIHWETLRHLEDGTRLFVDEKVYFSRFLHAQNGRATALRARDTLRSLVFISNPKDLSLGTRTNGFNMKQPLPPLDVAAEVKRAEEALRPPIKVIASSPERSGVASLKALTVALGHRYDILYLACHGAARDQRFSARVFLEDPDSGQMTTVAVDELAGRFASLAELPTVVVLASCESAGSLGDDDGLATLGPRLIEAGVLVVVAMQGRVSVATASEFSARLFAELSAHGEIDRAVAVARNQVEARVDWWMPVLFSRLREGAIWYSPGFGDQNAIAPFDSLIRTVRAGVESPLMPVVGPGILEDLLGSVEGFTSEYASRHWPTVPVSWSDLPKLAQYRATTEGRGTVVEEILELMRARASARALVPGGDNTADVLERAWRVQATPRDPSDPIEPHMFLASLDVPIFVTTSIDDSLAHALRALGKEPIVELFRWKSNMDLAPDGTLNVSAFETTPKRPARRLDPKAPLVFHLFGHIRDTKSLVLSEDDFFDYLMAARSEDFPPVVKTACNLNPLLFLGFRLEDWRFRLLFRSLFNREHRPVEPEWKSVAAQVIPEEGGVLPMKRYLEKSLSMAKIDGYWGRVRDFVRDFDAARQHFAARRPPHE